MPLSIHVSRHTACTWLDDLSYEHKAKKACIRTEARKARVREHLIDLVKTCNMEREEAVVRVITNS